MTVKHPQLDINKRGGSDTWDNGLAGQLLLQDYFEPALATTTYIISANTGADFGGVTDTYLLESNPTVNFGASARIGIKAWTTNDREHSVIKFGGITSITEHTVVSVRLRLYCNAIGNDPFDLPTLNVFKLRRAFVENQATWNIAVTGTNWGTSGALNTTNDFDDALLGSVLVNVENAYYEVTGAALISYVQAIISGGSDDGLLLTESNYLAPLNQFKEAFFVSSNGTDGFRPELIVEMTGAGGAITGTGASKSGASGNALGLKVGVSFAVTKAGVTANARGNKVALSTAITKLGASATAVGQLSIMASSVAIGKAGASGNARGVKVGVSLAVTKAGVTANARGNKIGLSAGITKAGASGRAVGVATAIFTGIAITKGGASGNARGVKVGVSFAVTKAGVTANARGIALQLIVQGRRDLPLNIQKEQRSNLQSENRQPILAVSARSKEQSTTRSFNVQIKFKR